MFEKISAGWRVLKAGEAVADPVAWKRGQITVSALATCLAAAVGAAKAFNEEGTLTEEQITAIATGVLAVVGVFNHFATAASTDKINGLGQTTGVAGANEPPIVLGAKPVNSQGPAPVVDINSGKAVQPDPKYNLPPGFSDGGS